MSAVRIGALGLRLQRPDRAAPATRIIEDAFRTAGLSPDGQLLVLRRLNLGRIASDGSNALALSGRIAEILRTAAFGAGDPATPAARMADAVVFPSADAARAALAVALLKQRSPPAGWWWRSAVPDWRGEIDPAPLMQALSRTPEGRIALASSVAAMVAEGVSTPLRALSAPLASTLLAIWPQPGIEISIDEAPQLWLALQQRIAASPHLASARTWALRVLAEPQAEARLPTPVARAQAKMPATRNPAPVTRPTSSVVVVRSEQPSVDPMATIGPAMTAVRRDGQPRPNGEVSRDREPDMARPYAAEVGWRSAVPDTLSVPPRELPTRFAGLFLSVGPLRRLGFEAWLARRPWRAEAGFGWRLLDHIGERAQVPPDDPARQMLHPTEPDVGNDDAVAWRAALDGLMRRRTRQPLARIVRRRGWIVRGQASIVVRFPADAADVTLRRHGFDIDPGFVPWLGLSVFYRYDDRAIP